MATFLQFTCQYDDNDESSEDVALKQRAPFAEDDIKPLLQVANIPYSHYAYCVFDIAFVMWRERSSCLFPRMAEFVKTI